MTKDITESGQIESKAIPSLQENRIENQNVACLAPQDRALCQSPPIPTKQVHWTLKDWLQVELNYLRSPSGNIFQGRNAHYVAMGEDLLNRWQSLGFPSLGEIPSDQTRIQLVDYCLGAIAGALAQHELAKASVKVPS